MCSGYASKRSSSVPATAARGTSAFTQVHTDELCDARLRRRAMHDDNRTSDDTNDNCTDEKSTDASEKADR